MEPLVKDLTSEERKSYFQSFADHPVIASMNEGGPSADPQQKIMNFLNLSDSDMDDLLKMQLILQLDVQAGGGLMKELATSGTGRGLMGSMHALGAMAMTGGGAASMMRNSSAPSSSGHQHHPGCQHYAADLNQNKPPNVVTGKGDTIER